MSTDQLRHDHGFLEPAHAGIVGTLVIACWSLGLIRDTGAILLNMNPDRRLGQRMHKTIEANGGEVADLHLWRLGPGRLGAIVMVATDEAHTAAHYRERLAGFTRFRTSPLK